MLTKTELLKVFKDSGVLKKGHFILASGRHASQYMQMAMALQDAKVTQLLCENLAENFKDQEIDVVISPAVGGLIVGYEMSRILGTRNLFCERENGEMTLRRGFTIEPGERVLVVEDVVTTGGSVKEVIKVVEDHGGEVVGVGVLVDRSNGKVEFGYPFAALLSLEVASYDPSECPLCQAGEIPAEKPGGRGK